MKKLITAALLGTLLIGAAASCDQKEGSADFDTSNEISVVTREDGSGTRSAFVELFEIVKEENGEKIDNIYTEAEITNGTDVMLTTVKDNQYSIGYVSLGSLGDTVKAVKIDGAQASIEAVNAGEYKIIRPFNIATKGQLDPLAKDFIDYILSADGQKVIEDNGYIKASDAAAYSGSKPSGSIVVGGSSSVSPVMEKLIEAYKKINKSANIDLQTSDSGAGMTGVNDGTFDIGMASRELKDSEKSGGATGTKIATDGIAVIVNKDNTTGNLTSEQVKAIFSGESTKWSDIAE